VYHEKPLVGCLLIPVTQDVIRWYRRGVVGYLGGLDSRGFWILVVHGPQLCLYQTYALKVAVYCRLMPQLYVSFYFWD
jgi:hypothetical protein